MVLGHIGVTATLLTLSQEQQELDVTLGLRVYARPGNHPSRAEVRTHLATAAENEDEVFRVMLETYLDGIAAQIASSGRSAAGRSAGRRARTRATPAAS